jgi:ABC-type dipeptide/oligopeptide/nickel transport system permease component
MLKYSSKRLLHALITLVIVIAIVFGLLRQMPIEGYFQNYDKLSAVQIENSIKLMGLDKPLPVQFIDYVGDVVQGDLGVSNKIRVNYPITKILETRMPLSLEIGLMSLGLSIVLGFPLGIAMARSARSKKRIKVVDGLGNVFISIMQSIPTAVYLLLIQIFGTELLGLFIPLNSYLFSADEPLTWILPVFSLALGSISGYALWMRRYMLDESTRDYAQLARAKGTPARTIFWKHIFRNAVVPMSQFIPQSIVLTLVGALYVENRYSIPGMGGLLVDAIQRQDNTLVQALVIIFTSISIIGVLFGDILMSIFDPRIRLSKKGVR